MDEFLKHLGITMADLFAGFAGGLVNAFVFRRQSPWEIVGSVVVGTLTAGYLGPSVGPFISEHIFGSASPSTGEGISFIVGLGGMSICQGIVAGIKRIRFGGSPAAPEAGDPHA